VPDHIIVACRPVGEREKKYAPWVYAMLDEIRHAMHERACFAGPRRSQNKNRPIPRRRCRALLWVEKFRKVSHVSGYYIKIFTRVPANSGKARARLG